MGTIGTREELHTILCETLGSSHVYYQPPESLQISYPCIVYSRSKSFERHANNNAYHRRRSYKLTYITRVPDEEVVDRIADLPYCSMEEPYTSDNLYHYPYTMYY